VIDFILMRSITPDELVLAPMGELDRDRVPADLLMIWSNVRFEVRADAVHLVDEADPRHAAFVGLAPDGLGSRLDAGDRVEHGDRAVEHAQRALDFAVKSTWPGVSMMLTRCSRQKQVVAADVIVMPRSCSCSIQSMTAVPSWTSPILRDARVEQDPFRGGGLAGIDVRHDADVARASERCFVPVADNYQR
jgi:hypothetical protein